MKRCSVSTRVLNKYILYLNFLLLTYFLSIAKKTSTVLQIIFKADRKRVKAAYEAKKSAKDTNKLRLSQFHECIKKGAP